MNEFLIFYIKEERLLATHVIRNSEKNVIYFSDVGYYQPELEIIKVSTRINYDYSKYFETNNKS